MSLAFSATQPNVVTLTPQSLSLRERIQSAIALHTEFQPDSILTQENRDKYSAQGSNEDTSDHLVEVFDLMRELNEQGLASETLGQSQTSSRSFRKALFEICESIAQNIGAQPLTYVELGPEPVKTSYILHALQELGIEIGRYIAIDINPESTAHMRPVLEKILPGIPLDFVTTTFEAFRIPDTPSHQDGPALITMLGFQEGNDDPAVVNKWLREIARPGDYLLSENQLHTQTHLGKISEFYRHPAMLRFSRIAFEKAVAAETQSLNRFFLLPVVLHDGKSVQVAILAEEFATNNDQRNLHVSNFCLKLTADQHRYYREVGGHFQILDEAASGDETLHFQLSRRI